MANYHISLQGIDREVSHSTGLFDPVEMGQKNTTEAEILLNRCVKIKVDPKHFDADYCPPGINLIREDGEVVSFTVVNRKLQSADNGKSMGAAAALRYVSEKQTGQDLEALRAEREAKGVVPVRKKNIKPTDKNKINEKTIDTGPDSPQIELVVWKSHDWFEAARYIPWITGAFFLLIGLVIFGNQDDRHYAIIPLILAVGFFFLAIPLKSWGKTRLRMGFDWKTNTVWMKHGRKKLAFEPDANLIVRFDKLYYNFKRINQNWAQGTAQPLYYNAKVEWHIAYYRSGSETLWCNYKFGLATKKDADRVLSLLNGLLEDQNTD